MNVAQIETDRIVVGGRPVPEAHKPAVYLAQHTACEPTGSEPVGRRWLAAPQLTIARRPWVGVVAAMALGGCAAEPSPHAGQVATCDVICHLLRLVSLEEAQALPLPVPLPKPTRRFVPMPPARPRMARHEASRRWIAPAEFKVQPEQSWSTPPLEPDQNWQKPLPGSPPIKTPWFEPMMPLRPVAPSPPPV